MVSYKNIGSKGTKTVVLILIVVDNGLVHEDVAFAGNHLIKHVLILIVVDNGLVLVLTRLY